MCFQFTCGLRRAMSIPSCRQVNCASESRGQLSRPAGEAPQHQVPPPQRIDDDDRRERPAWRPPYARQLHREDLQAETFGRLADSPGLPIVAFSKPISCHHMPMLRIPAVKTLATTNAKGIAVQRA